MTQFRSKFIAVLSALLLCTGLATASAAMHKSHGAGGGIVPITSIDTSAFPGDGWDSATYGSNVYVVWHAKAGLNLMCYSIATGDPCANYPVTITNDGDTLTVSGNPTIYRSLAGYLYVYAVDDTTLTPGVAKLDLNNGGALVSFTNLAPAGSAWIENSSYAGVSNAVLSGTRFMAFNAVPNVSSPTGAQDTLLCFDVSSDAPCANQPYAVNYGDGSYGKNVWYNADLAMGPYLSTQTSLVGGNVLVEVGGDNAN
jgi:hypothetical protein